MVLVMNVLRDLMADRVQPYCNGLFSIIIGSLAEVIPYKYSYIIEKICTCVSVSKKKLHPVLVSLEEPLF